MNDAIPTVLSRYIDGLKRRDVQQIGSTLAEDVAVVLPGRTLRKPEFLGFLANLYRGFPDWHYDHDDPEPFGPPGSFRIRWRQSGTHTELIVRPGGELLKATGIRVRIPEQQFFYKIADDKLIEVRPDPIPGGMPDGIFEQLDGTSAPRP